jgi:chromosome segregation ATPase
MSDPFPTRADPFGPSVVASRVQARLDTLAPSEPVPGAEPIEEPEAPDRWVAREGGRVDRLDRQLRILRDQLDQVFDDIEDRLADAEARIGVAEARASVAETRATVAETRAADAEARANEAHHRVDELLAELHRLAGADGSNGPERADLRSALERLRGRLEAS